MSMRTLTDIPHLNDVPVLVRAALNVPIKDGKVLNTFRLRQALPTIEYLRKNNAKIILIGHLTGEGTETLAPVADAMRTLIPGLVFCPTTIGPEARAAVRTLAAGSVLMLENLRRDQGEEKNDPVFATELASLADIFVQDSFDVCHRMHASVVGVPQLLPSYAGLLVEEEVRQLSKALTPAHPALAVIGGAKFSTKEPVLKKLLSIYDNVFVGGALGNDFIQAMGHSVGTSLVSNADLKAVKRMTENRQLLLPSDAIVAPIGSLRDQGRAAGLDDVKANEAILDDGPATIATLTPFVANAKTILWNGPLGNYENGFSDATRALAKLIATSGAYSILGGGDTVAAVEDLGLSSNFSFISTGGGAMLDFLANGTLPGVAILG